MTMFNVYSYNVVTEEKLFMGAFESEEEAREACEWENLEWDEGDVCSEWQILLTEDGKDFEEIIVDFTVEWEEDDYDETRFDPYEDYYTYDCEVGDKMGRSKKLKVLKQVVKPLLLQYAYEMLRDDYLEDDVEKLVEKTLDKFANDCYNVLRKQRKEI